jgi:hypothetical protein
MAALGTGVAVGGIGVSVGVGVLLTVPVVIACDEVLVALGLPVLQAVTNRSNRQTNRIFFLLRELICQIIPVFQILPSCWMPGLT